MEHEVESRHDSTTSLSASAMASTSEEANTVKGKNKSKDKDNNAVSKRRCVSTACIACRRRKSKCDGNLPKCAACASVYLTECEYAPHTDHRRKGVYKKDVDNIKTKNSTLQTLIHALLNYEEDEAFDLLRQIRGCDNLEELAQTVENKEKGFDIGSPDSPVYGNQDASVPQFEAELSGKMGDLFMDGSVKFIGGTSNLIWLEDSEIASPSSLSSANNSVVKPREDAITGWTTVIQDKEHILHFMNMYFCWHYAYFTTLSKELFYRDFLTGVHSQYCSPFLVNVMLALGCHFSTRPAARLDPEDSATIGDHFFAEAKRLLHKDDEWAIPKLCTVQGLALMSVREAGCGRESKGWVYSGMSFRMASDLGLNVDAGSINSATKRSDEDIDARRITFWGCFFFDKCWSNYLGRQPQLVLANINVKKPDVYASEDSEMWSPYTDSGVIHAHRQPARTRAVALQIFKLAEISSDLMTAFYQPQNPERPIGKQAELKRLSDIHTRLEAWKQELAGELDPKEGQLPQVLLMHMFYQLLYIHLYRPFLKYTKATSPLPAHISPRKFCTQAAGAISKLFRLYKRTHGLRQICNIAVYIAHSACTIHLLNLPDKNAKRDIVHGIKQLEEIGEFWTCARRTLRILYLCADKWKIDLPDEAQSSFARSRQRWGSAEPSPAATSPHDFPSLIYQSRPQQPADTFDKIMQLQSMPRDNVPVQPTVFARQSQLDAFSVRPSGVVERHQTQVRPPTPQQSSIESSSKTIDLKPLAQLSRVQQDLWNAHHAKMANPHNGIPKSASKTTSKNAAVLFGGVDSLMEDSQDWWYNDQSQLALGFDNWNSPSTADWSGMGNNISLTATSESSLTSPSAASPYFGREPVTNSYTAPSNGAMSNQFQGLQQQQQQQQQHRLPQVQPHAQNQHQQRLLGMDSLHDGVLQRGSEPTAQKRMGPFDDNDDFIY